MARDGDASVSLHGDRTRGDEPAANLVLGRAAVVDSVGFPIDEKWH